ncbi:MAG: excinuclease ABC subunit UvrB [Candidatus Lokiarchaeota archaeon]|nr:excinuclease ABC subunit UvrB [Candidatus Lokiarchaeota archaeon]
MKKFRLKSNYKPMGDQPTAISDIIKALKRGDKFITLLGATGTGKTFTISNIIEKVQRPTLVMAPNKTLAAQLFQEFTEFFPDNAVEYFVSYYDYYQPEAYLPSKGQYIEKDLDINEQIQQYRLSAMKSLLTRQDVIVVASVSCIYGLQDPEVIKNKFILIKKGERISIRDLSKKLIKIQYERNDVEVKPGLFRVKGDTMSIYPSDADIGYKIMFFGDEIEEISIINFISGKTIDKPKEIVVFPAKEFITNTDELDRIIDEIKHDMEEEVEDFKEQNKLVEAQRLEQRTNYDLEMIQEIGHVKGIENYSRYLDNRKEGDPPFTLLDYFPENYLMVLDESHIGVPQIHGMIGGDRSRKKNLIDYGFRLKAAYDNRPLTFEEWENRINQAIFTSATPGEYELSHSRIIAEQIIRPTGLVDPYVEIRPTDNQIDDLLSEIQKVTARQERILVTTLTKKLAENIAEYYAERNLKINYLHSSIDTIERSEILRKLRAGDINVVIGINLLREGLDLPEVSLVAILDADKEGFLRDTRSLIQTIGRASRNVNGHVILYADTMTKSMQKAIKETNRRRRIQQKFNKDHGIEPKTIEKALTKSLSLEELEEDETEERKFRKTIKEKIEEQGILQDKIADLEAMMMDAASNLEFEKAAYIRDEIWALRKKI